MEAFEKSLRMQEKLGDIRGKAVTLANIGGVHQRQGNWQEALQALEQSLAYHGQVGDTLGMAATLNTLGGVQRRLGDLDGAYRSYARAKNLMQSSGDLLCVTVPAHNMALIHEERGEYREALRILEEVVGIDKRIGHPDLRQDLEAFGRIREKLDRQRDPPPAG
jgi:tetratricopeptide (TPR) repeat protein